MVRLETGLSHPFQTYPVYYTQWKTGMLQVNMEKVGRTLDKRIQCLLRYNSISLDMYSGLSQVYCFKPEGRLH